jgi:hypothetical protein
MKTWVFSINDSASIAGRSPLAPGSPAASARPPTMNALAATIAAKANLCEILCMHLPPRVLPATHIPPSKRYCMVKVPHESISI